MEGLVEELFKKIGILDLGDKELIELIVSVIKKYPESVAETILERIVEIPANLYETEQAEKAEIAEATKFVTKVIGEYSNLPQVGETIARKLCDVANDTKDIKTLESVAKMYLNVDVRNVIESYYKSSPQIAEVIACDLASVALETKDDEAVKKFCKLLKDREIGEFIYREDSRMIEDLITKIIKYYNLVEKEKIEGIKKALISEILNVNPDNFYGEIKERTKNEFGSDLSRLTLQELYFTTLSFKKLYEEEQVKSFKKLLELLASEKYWEDEEIVKILKEMKKFNINTENLKGKNWVYKRNGEYVENLSYEEALDNLILALITRKDEIYKEALNKLKKIESEEKIKRARGLVNSSKKLVYELYNLYREGKLEEALNRLEKFLEGNKDTEAKKNLRNLVQSVKGLKRGVIAGNYLVGYYGKYIVNLYSNQSTMCCAFLPDGLGRYGSVLYLLDPRVLLIGYTFVKEFDPKKPMKTVRERGEMDGVVISYIGLYENKPILIVDSVGGGRTFRNYLEKNFKVIKGDIKRVAKEIGAKYIIYNSRTFFEETPIYFNKKLRESGAKETTINTEIIGPETIPYDYTNYNRHYFEGFGKVIEGVIPKGNVKGYLYEV